MRRFAAEMWAAVFLFGATGLVGQALSQQPSLGTLARDISTGTLDERVTAQGAWIIGHNARIEETWRGQEKFNDRTEARLQEIGRQVEAIERKLADISAKLVLLTTAASAVGAFLFRALTFGIEVLGGKRRDGGSGK